jgi:UbiD family decarboxylase
LYYILSERGIKMGFRDLIEWLNKLESVGELKRIKAQVDWDKEIGAITHMAWQRGFSNLLFENIKGYQNTRFSRLCVMSIGNPRQIAMMFGLPKDTQPRDLVSVFRERAKNYIKPVTVTSGQVKENIVKGNDISLYDFPVPIWHRLDGGRYINTLGGVVTRDPENGIMNVGIYRGMIAGKNRIVQTIVPSQHIGQHFAKYGEMGREMPVAVVYGWDPTLALVASAKIPKDVCEYDVMGSIRQEPVELVKCETSDLEVPASAEIVVEGFVSSDTETYDWEGPFGEYTGYYGSERNRSPVIRVECITHRNDPIYVGTLSGARLGMPSRATAVINIPLTAMVWDVVERAGIPGLLDVRFLPPSIETSVILKVHKTYRGQGKQIACALIGSDLPVTCCKNIMVVDDDIDIYNYEALVWAFDYRVNPMENDLVLLPDMPGSVLDPSIPMDKKDFVRYGGGAENRLIIDATKNWGYGRREEWDNDFYPPVAFELSDEEKELIERRWQEYGIE